MQPLRATETSPFGNIKKCIYKNNKNKSFLCSFAIRVPSVPRVQRNVYWCQIFRLHACTKMHHGYRHLMSDIHKSNIWFLFSNTLRIWSGLLEVWDVSVFGLRAGGVYVPLWGSYLWSYWINVQQSAVTDPGSVKSLGLRHHTLPFGLLKSMCTGLYQSTRKQCCVYCCSESARSVSLIHGISECSFVVFWGIQKARKLDTHRQNWLFHISFKVISVKLSLL